MLNIVMAINYILFSITLIISYIHYTNAAPLLTPLDNLSSDARKAAETLRESFNQDNILTALSLNNNKTSLLPLLASIDSKYNLVFELGKFLQQASQLMTQTSEYANQIGEKLRKDGFSEEELLALDKAIRLLTDKINSTFHPNLAQSFSPIISPKIDLADSKSHSLDFKKMMPVNPIEILKQTPDEYFNLIKDALITGKEVNHDLLSLLKTEERSTSNVKNSNEIKSGIEILKLLRQAFNNERNKNEKA